ncbi:unnamed protein product [Amoebophrya sp. A120]|nr:unnamed protein product [Amoebophrya sp. A120]|eukprot:GSA120T00010319001.1
MVANPAFWHQWLKDGGLPDAEVEPDLISMRPDQVMTRMRTWLRYPERALSIRWQSVLTDMIQVLTDLGMQLNDLYSMLSNDRFSVVALCDVFAAYDEIERVTVQIKRKKRRKFIETSWNCDKEKRFLLMVFLEWKRTVEYERDIEVLKQYVENTKIALQDAVEANAMHDFLLQFKFRLENEVLPALEKTEQELIEVKVERDALQKAKIQLEKELKQVKKELEITKQLYDRINRKIRRYIPNVAKLGERLGRFMEEALVRFVLQGFTANKLQELRFMFKKLSAAHADTLLKVEEDAKEIRGLNDNIADLELKVSKLEEALAHNIERKKHYAERTRMANNELQQQTATRIQHEHEIRNVLLPKIERILQEFADFRKETAKKEQMLNNRIKKLQEDLDDMRAKYLFEKREKELYQQRSADFEFQTQQLTEKSGKLEKENTAMKRKIAQLTKENQQLLLLTQGIGPPVPGGYMCLVCQEDIMTRNRQAKLQSVGNADLARVREREKDQSGSSTARRESQSPASQRRAGAANNRSSSAEPGPLDAGGGKVISMQDVSQRIFQSPSKRESPEKKQKEVQAALRVATNYERKVEDRGVTDSSGVDGNLDLGFGGSDEPEQQDPAHEDQHGGTKAEEVMREGESGAGDETAENERKTTGTGNVVDSQHDGFWDDVVDGGGESLLQGSRPQAALPDAQNGKSHQVEENVGTEGVTKQAFMTQLEVDPRVGNVAGDTLGRDSANEHDKRLDGRPGSGGRDAPAENDG